jgi:hypothetical protein
MTEGQPASRRNNEWIPLAVVLVLALIIATFIVSGMLGDDGGGEMEMDHGVGTTAEPVAR